MTTKTNPLAVMDELHLAVDAYQREGGIRYHKDGAYHMELTRQHYEALELRDRLLAARAAVAELIEAANRLNEVGFDVECAMTDLEYSSCLDARRKFRDAIARVSGG